MEWPKAGETPRGTRWLFASWEALGGPINVGTSKRWGSLCCPMSTCNDAFQLSMMGVESGRVQRRAVLEGRKVACRC